MKRLRLLIAGIATAMLGTVIMPVLAHAVATNTITTITPTSTVYGDNNTVGVVGDAAPGFPSGSIKSNGTAKTDAYLTPESLFGREVTVGEVASISYYTKKSTDHVTVPGDWFVNIYTKPYAGEVGSNWYGTRIGAEPYLSQNLTDPVNTWNKWVTSGATNQLRYFESTYGYFGSYTDPDFATFKTQNSLAGIRGPGVPYATQPILFFSPQTASAWAAGFTGQIDGLQIELTDGSTAKVNFEAVNATVTKPVISIPANNSTVTTAQLVKIDWSDSVASNGTGVTYQYRAFSDSTYTTQVYASGDLTASEIPTPGTPAGVYYVQVQAKDALGNLSGWSNDSTSPYKITVDNTAPNMPVHLLPANNSTIFTHNFAFTWTTVTDPSSPVSYDWAMSYSGIVSGPNNAFTAPAIVHTGLTSPMVNSPGTPDDVYFWQVRAVDAAGNASLWTNPWKVTVHTSPSTKDECKKDGWKLFTDPSFRNQGQCVSFVEKMEKEHHENQGKHENNDDHEDHIELSNHPRF